MSLIRNLRSIITRQTAPPPPPQWTPPEDGEENWICLVCSAGDIAPDDIITVPGNFLRHANGDTTHIHGKTFAVCAPCRDTVRGKVYIEVNRRLSQELLSPEEESRLTRELERKYAAGEE